MTFVLTLIVIGVVIGIVGLVAILALALHDSKPSERPEIVRAVAELLGRRPPR